MATAQTQQDREDAAILDQLNAESEASIPAVENGIGPFDIGENDLQSIDDISRIASVSNQQSVAEATRLASLPRTVDIPQPSAVPASAVASVAAPPALTREYGPDKLPHIKTYEVRFRGPNAEQYQQPVRCRAISDDEAWMLVVSFYKLGLSKSGDPRDLDPTRYRPTVTRVED